MIHKMNTGWMTISTCTDQKKVRNNGQRRKRTI